MQIMQFLVSLSTSPLSTPSSPSPRFGATASRPNTFCSAYILPVLHAMAIFVTPQSSKLFITSLDVEEESPVRG